MADSNTTVFKNNVEITGNLLVDGTITPSETSFDVPVVIDTADANALDVGPNGATNPTLQVSTNTASAATGLKLTSAAAAAGVALAAISSGTNENLTIDAKGTGTTTINGTATGNVVMGSALTGVSSSMTGGYVSKSGTAAPASAGAIAAGAPISMFSNGIKIWVTSDAPAFSGTKGDLAINLAGSSSSTRLFINNGTTNWVAITTAT